MTAPRDFTGHTPGPWKATADMPWPRQFIEQRRQYGYQDTSDAALAYTRGFCAGANTADDRHRGAVEAAPALLTERDALREQVAKLAGALRELLESLDSAEIQPGTDLPPYEFWTIHHAAEGRARAILARVRS